MWMGWQVERPRAALGLSELEQGGQLADALISVHFCFSLILSVVGEERGGFLRVPLCLFARLC